MEKKIYKWMHSRLTVAELWGAVDGNLYYFLNALIRFKFFGRQRAYDFGTVRAETFAHIDPARLPEVVKDQLANLLSECAGEGISIGLVLEEAHLTPDFLYMLLLKSDDSRILNKIVVHVSRSQPSRSGIVFKCVTFCTDGQVIETNNKRWDMRGPSCWNTEHYPGN